MTPVDDTAAREKPTNREAAAYWLAHAESVGAEDKVLLAAENRAHEAATEAGFPDNFDAARAVALAVLAVAEFAAVPADDTAARDVSGPATVPAGVPDEPKEER